MIRVRKIRKDEVELYRELRLRALRDAPYAFGATLEGELSIHDSHYVELLSRWAESEVSTMFVAFDTSELIGNAGAFFEQETGRAFLCALWVDPAHRYKGVGREVVFSTISWLACRGAENIFAWVADSNVSAIEFYKALGFGATNEIARMPSYSDHSETLYKISEKEFQA